MLLCTVDLHRHGALAQDVGPKQGTYGLDRAAAQQKAGFC
jgi:hypothetical protein